MELTKEEKAFLKSLLDMVPNMSVPAKDAPMILSLTEQILAKLEKEND